MENGLTRLIEAWFLEHDGDGEFLSHTRGFPYSVIGSLSASGCIIFTTKPQSVAGVMQEADASRCIGMVGRYGLPDKEDILWIRKVIGRQQLVFLGDMDPVDLMVFAWLRASLRSKHVTYLGINDALLNALGLSSIKSLSSVCAPSERRSLALLEKVFPDLRETLGEKCAEILGRGHKIELEVIGRKRRRMAKALPSLLAASQSQKQKKRRNETGAGRS